jgi:hypothetical protein
MPTKVNIEKAKITNSPIIVDAPNAYAIVNESPKSKDKGLLSNPWVVTIGGGIIVSIVLGLLFSAINNGEDSMNENSPKVNIEDSNLNRSPVIVDSPGATVGENIIITSEKPGRHLNDQLKAQIDDKIREQDIKEASVTYWTGNSEAKQFATETAVYLKSKDIKVSGPNPAIFFGDSTAPQSMFVNREGILVFQIGNYE